MSLDPDSQIARENEITLLICSERPEELEKDLASLSEIREYLLSPACSETIEDAYLDTAGKVLAAEHWALRIRKDMAGYWITLKGPSQITNLGGLERFELEAPWSLVALQNVLTKLDQADLALTKSDASVNPADPIETMKSLGFDIIQSRGLQRRHRSISTQRGGPEIAQLAIDDVTYRFAFEEVSHSEVEIEAKTAEVCDAIKDVAEALLDRYGPALRRWPYSKLATGQAIEQLLLVSRIHDLMNRNRLEPEAYTIIAELLESKTKGK